MWSFGFASALLGLVDSAGRYDAMEEMSERLSEEPPSRFGPKCAYTIVERPTLPPPFGACAAGARYTNSWRKKRMKTGALLGLEIGRLLHHGRHSLLALVVDLPSINSTWSDHNNKKELRGHDRVRGASSGRD